MSAEGNFVQILQGDKSLLLNLFEIIKGDTRHDGIVLMSQDIETGCSNGYAADILGKIIKHQKETPQEYT